MKKRPEKEWKEIKTNIASLLLLAVAYNCFIIQGIMTATTLN